MFKKLANSMLFQAVMMASIAIVFAGGMIAVIGYLCAHASFVSLAVIVFLLVFALLTVSAYNFLEDSVEADAKKSRKKKK